MKEFDNKKEYQNCMPETLSIDKLGWKAFLAQWNNEIIFWVKKTILQFGIDPYSLYTQEEWKQYVKENNLSSRYQVLHQGGLNFPPNNDSEKKRIDAMLTLHRDYEREFYNRIIKEQQKTKDFLPFISSEHAIIFYDSLMFDPASEKTIKAKEKELGITLPDTYKDFLKVSNGWMLDDLMLSPVEDISWIFSAEQASFILWNEMIWDERYPDLKPGDPVPDLVRIQLGEDYERYEFERAGLLISKSFYGNYLVFNPHRLVADGDWLGWSDSGDGARRTISPPPLKPFKKLMEEYYQRDIARRCVTYKELEHIN